MAEKIMELIETKNEPISKEERREFEEALFFINKNILPDNICED